MAVRDRATPLGAQVTDVGLAMVIPLFRSDNPVETQVTPVDVRLQVFAFTGDLSTDVGLDMLVQSAFSSL